MRIVGLTGGIGSGKSLVSSIFAADSSGFFGVVDCDKISHEILQIGKPAYKKVLKAFGDDLERFMGEDGVINRKKLGEIVFRDKSKLKMLTGITGPAIRNEIMKQLLWHFMKGTAVVILDAPTLFETKGLVKFCAAIIVVAASEEIQIKRVMDRDHVSESEVKQRISNQLPTGKKVELADFVIWNEETREEAELRVQEISNILRVRYGGFVSRIMLSAQGVIATVALSILTSFILRLSFQK